MNRLVVLLLSAILVGTGCVREVERSANGPTSTTLPAVVLEPSRFEWKAQTDGSFTVIMDMEACTAGAPWVSDPDDWVIAWDRDTKHYSGSLVGFGALRMSDRWMVGADDCESEFLRWDIQDGASAQGVRWWVENVETRDVWDVDDATP